MPGSSEIGRLGEEKTEKKRKKGLKELPDLLAEGQESTSGDQLPGATTHRVTHFGRPLKVEKDTTVEPIITRTPERPEGVFNGYLVTKSGDHRVFTAATREEIEPVADPEGAMRDIDELILTRRGGYHFNRFFGRDRGRKKKKKRRLLGRRKQAEVAQDPSESPPVAPYPVARPRPPLPKRPLMDRLGETIGKILGSIDL
jgi:hypothetical protein